MMYVILYVYTLYGTGRSFWKILEVFSSECGLLKELQRLRRAHEGVEGDKLRSACEAAAEARALLVALRSRLAAQKELEKGLKEKEKELFGLRKELKEMKEEKEMKGKEKKVLRRRHLESVQKLEELAEQLREPMEDARHCEVRHLESLAREEETICRLQATLLTSFRPYVHIFSY